MTDEPKKGNKSLAVVLFVLLLGGVVVGLVLKSHHAKSSKVAPVAALRVDSLDETNRIVTLSDNSSHDPDGTLQRWRIAWGDGKEDNLTSVPLKTPHTYDAEGEYTISLWCVDNYGTTSSPPAMTNITLDFLKRQKALEEAQAEAKRQADQLKAEQARKEAERLEQERQKELAAQEAQKAKERQELEQKQKAEAELAQQKAKQAAATPVPPPPTPLAAALPEDNPSSRMVVYTPAGYTLGEFQISKEKIEGTEQNGNLRVILATRCVNFPDTPIVTSAWQIDGQDTQLQVGRIRTSLAPGVHLVTATLTRKTASDAAALQAELTVRTNGDCVLKRK